MAGGQLVRAGETVEALAADARLLIGMGKAIAATVVEEIKSEPAATTKRKPRIKVTPNGNLSADS